MDSNSIKKALSYADYLDYAGLFKAADSLTKKAQVNFPVTGTVLQEAENSADNQYRSIKPLSAEEKV